MASEIERKFLTKGSAWRRVQPVRVRQGFLSSVKGRTVRVRIAEDRAFLTIKGIAVRATRPEFEYEIPLEDARQLLNLCEKPLIEKDRYRLEEDGVIWEVDEFHGDNEGLILAEVELESEEQPFSKPEWLGEEVTGDPRYYNSNLIQNPFTNWQA
ncbi:MAG: CYTH domain-containing protein [Deltaproteobacteria bacterium]|nr:CYTH domain-containing protein [Deltaproteobacteria bacterium]